MSRLNIVVDFY